MPRVHTDAQVESVLAGELHHVLVAGNTGSLKGLPGYILLLPTAQCIGTQARSDPGGVLLVR